MSLKSREARALAKASTAALVILSATGATAAHAAVPSVPDVTLEYTCKYPIVDVQPLSIKVSSNIPQEALLRVNQPAFKIDATATAGGDTARAINTLNAYGIEGVSEAFADLEFPDGFVQEDLFVPLTVNKWVRPSSAPVTGNLVLTASGDTPSVQLEPTGNARILLDRITLNLKATGQSGNVINVRKLTTGINGEPVTDSDGSADTFDVYCKLVDPTKNLIATIKVVEKLSGDNTAPSKVTGLASTAKTSTSVDLKWNAATDTDAGDSITEYRVYQGTSTTPVATVPGTATTAKISGLTANTDYSFTVEAVDKNGPLAGPKSDALSVKTDPAVVPNNPPSQVTGLASPAKSTTTVDLTWAAATDTDAGDAIKEYRVYQGTTLAKTVAAPATSTQITGLTADTDYSFSVEAVDTKGPVAGARSAALAVKTSPVVVTCTTDTVAPSKPGEGVYNTDGSDVTATTLNVRWGASTDTAGPGCPVSGLDYYLVSSENEPDRKVPAPALSTLFTGLGEDSDYRFQIVAVDKAGNKSEESEEFLITDGGTPVNIPPTAPTNVKGTPGTTTVDLTWTASTDSDGTIAGYNVYRGTTKIATVTDTKYTATGLTANTSYDFAVEAIDDKGAPAASDPITVKTNPVVVANKPPAPAPVATAGTATETSIPLTWTKSTDPDAGDTVTYNVYVNGTKKNTAPITGTSFDVTGLTAGTKYSLQVEATDGKADGSVKGAAIDATTKAKPVENVKPTAPSDVKGTPKQTTADLTWTASTDSDGTVKSYNVYVGGKLAGSTAATGLTITGLTPETAYKVRVEAVDDKGAKSDLSTEITVTTLKGDAPVGQAPTVKTIIGRTAFTYIGGIALVQGTNYNKVQSVTVGGKNAGVNVLGSNLLLVILPPINKKGQYDLIVKTAAGSSAVSGATKINYVGLW